MSSGQTYNVRHPDMARLSKSSIYVGIDDVDDDVPADFRICSLLHVMAVEPLNAAEAK